MSVEYSKAPFPWFGAIGALKMLEIRQQKGVAGIFLSPLIRLYCLTIKMAVRGLGFVLVPFGALPDARRSQRNSLAVRSLPCVTIPSTPSPATAAPRCWSRRAWAIHPAAPSN